jgi:hypothetical protein
MPDDEFGCPELWDEYEWERFLQQQDRKTDQYFALFEKYSDHPDRDEIIAREMGWNHVMDDSDDAPEDWAVAVEFSSDDDEEDDEEEDELELDDDDEIEDDDEDDEDDELNELQNSEVYLQSMELNRRVFALVEGRDTLKDNLVAVEMASRVAICGAKLAAALCGDDYSEVGMTIAYLKRSLKAATDSLNAAYKLHESGDLSRPDLESLTDLLFPIRERIVDMMGEYRVELRRRRGEL